MTTQTVLKFKNGGMFFWPAKTGSTRTFIVPFGIPRHFVSNNFPCDFFLFLAMFFFDTISFELISPLEFLFCN